MTKTVVKQPRSTGVIVARGLEHPTGVMKVVASISTRNSENLFSCSFTANNQDVKQSSLHHFAHGCVHCWFSVITNMGVR